MQPLWRTVWRFLKKLKIELPYDPAIPFLGIYPDKTIIKKDTCTPIFWASLVAQTERILLQCRRPGFDPWVGKIPWRRERLPIPVFLGFPGASDSKESACNVGDLGSIPDLGRSPGGGHGNPL